MTSLFFLDDVLLVRVSSLLDARDYLHLFRTSRRLRHVIRANRALLRKSRERNVELCFYELGITIGLFNGRGLAECFEVRPYNTTNVQVHDGFVIEDVLLADPRPSGPDHTCQTLTTTSYEETLKILFRFVTQFHTYSTIRIFSDPVGYYNQTATESLVSTLAQAVKEESLTAEKLSVELCDVHCVSTLDEKPLLELLDAAEVKGFGHTPPRHDRTQSIQWRLTADFFDHPAVRALEAFHFAATISDGIELTNGALISWPVRNIEIFGSRTEVTAAGINAWLSQAIEDMGEGTMKLGLTLEGDEDDLWEQIIGEYGQFLTRKGDLKVNNKRVRLSFHENCCDSNEHQKFTHVQVTVKKLH